MYGRMALVVALLVTTGVATADVIAHWSFDTDFSDTTPHGNHLSVGGSDPVITSTDWKLGGGALDLDGNDWLSIATAINFAASDPWSVAFWGKRRVGAAAPDGMVIGSAAEAGNFIWTPDNSNVVQGLRFRNTAGANADFSGIADDHLYHHWAVVADGTGSLEVYRDAVSLGTRFPSGGTQFKATGIGHAYNGTSQIYNGQIDELYVYDEAIDAQTVRSLFDAAGDDPDPPDPPEPTHYKVFLLAGQSNMDGRGLASELPTELQNPQPDVLLYEGGAASPLTPVGGRFGPEVTFGRTVADAFPEDDFVLIKHASGGIDLHTDWDPNSGPVYSALRTKVTNGLAALESNNSTTEIVGMLWTQGERDAKDNRTTAQYQADLVEFIADVRTRYGDDLPFFLSQLSIEQTNISAAQLEEIRAAQHNAAAMDSNVFMINTDSFGMKSDNLHFDALGLQALGNAFGAAYVESVSDSELMPGDIDQNGAVDRRDVVLFATHFGTDADSTFTTGDFNNDRITNVSDLALLQHQMAQRSQTEGLANAVPEPTTAMLLLGGVVFSLSWRRNGR